MCDLSMSLQMPGHWVPTRRTRSRRTPISLCRISFQFRQAAARLYTVPAARQVTRPEPPALPRLRLRTLRMRHVFMPDATVSLQMPEHWVLTRPTRSNRTPMCSGGARYMQLAPAFSRLPIFRPMYRSPTPCPQAQPKRPQDTPLMRHASLHS